jgi:hypothetical protein
MRTFPKLLIGAVAAVAIAGVAMAAVTHTRVLTVRLPGGGVERIFYTGDTAPRVAFAAASPAGFADPFVMMERISAEMDRETAVMLGQGGAITIDPLATAQLIRPDRLMAANLGEMARLPAGASGYSFVSTMSGSGVCSRSVEITSRGDGGKPVVVTHTAGDCAEAPTGAPTVRTQESPTVGGPRLFETTWAPARSAKPRLQPVSTVSD